MALSRFHRIYDAFFHAVTPHLCAVVRLERNYQYTTVIILLARRPSSADDVNRGDLESGKKMRITILGGLESDTRPVPSTDLNHPC